MNWQIRGTEIHRQGKFLARFPYPIKEARQFGDILVVLLEVPADVTFPENVFGIDLRTGAQWQIEAKCYYKQAIPETCFVAMADELANGNLCLNTWAEQMVHVDVTTGRVVHVESLR